MGVFALKARLMRNKSWVLLGDFNASLNLEDHSSRGYEPNIAMHDFKNDDFPGSFAIFHPYHISDHSLCVLSIPTGLKSPFRELLHAQGNLNNRVDLLRKELDKTQIAIDKDPHNLNLGGEHAHYLLVFKEASLDEEREVTDNEIKEAIFSMGDDKAPGPDGVTSFLFKKAWDVVGNDVTNAILSTTARISDYRPISCCNMLFKCISKIIANRIKGNLDDIVSIDQSTFLLGRRISDNILLTQEFMRNYHRKRGFGFHHKMVNWIMTCVSTTTYSICVNGDLHGWFRGHPSSVDVIMQGLEEFNNVLCLVPSISKSAAFFCNVPNALKATILNSMPFAEGSLPVSDFISNGKWRWPPDWLVRTSVRTLGMSSIHVPNLSIDCDDVRLWHDLHGNLKPFLVSCAWDSIRSRADVVDWLRQWDVSPSIDLNLLKCPLYDVVPDSHSHLFFECPFSMQVWFQIERNSRLFKKKTSTVPQIVQVITSMVHLKLVTLKFKKMSTRSRLLLDQWKIPSCCMVLEESSRYISSNEKGVVARSFIDDIQDDVI
nr:hypothetical protein [Tanacetum cinerariifolium]